MITKKEIKEIKGLLPRGFIKEIAIRASLSESSVEKFFAGSRYNLLIHETAVELANEYSKNVESIKNKLITK